MKPAMHLNIGDHILAENGREYTVLEVRLDPFAPGPNWIVVRLREVGNPVNEGEICCNSADEFRMAEAVSQ
jgi:hypothetical protein